MRLPKPVRFALIFLAAALFLYVAVILVISWQAVHMFDDISRSHVKGNIPMSYDFDRLLRRDLEIYFRIKNGIDVSVEYILLRNNPTQVGVSYPKYYLWATVLRGDSVVAQGAVLVAAIERRQFEIQDFLSRSEITARPGRIYELFPAPVCKKIEEKLVNGG